MVSVANQVRHDKGQKRGSTWLRSDVQLPAADPVCQRVQFHSVAELAVDGSFCLNRGKSSTCRPIWMPCVTKAVHHGNSFFLFFCAAIILFNWWFGPVQVVLSSPPFWHRQQGAAGLLLPAWLPSKAKAAVGIPNGHKSGAVPL